MTKHPGRRVLILSIAIISLATLVPTGDGGSSAGFCLLCGDRGASDFLSNILLFAPFGFALARRGHPFARAAVVGAFFAIGIEAAQLSLIAGRDANIGDVVANGLGTALGWTIGFNRAWWTQHDGGMRQCMTVVAVTLALLLGGLALFTPSLPESTWYMQWTARFGDMASYHGRVLSTRVGSLDVPPGRQRREHTDSVRRMLFTEPIEVAATADLPTGIAPIMSIYDGDQREIVLLGAERADLIYRYRTLADGLRLDHGDLRVHQAFEHISQGSTYRLRWSVDKRGYCLDLEGRSECGRGFTVGDTWTLLMALDWGTDERVALRALWLWLLFIPAGFRAARLSTLGAAGLLAGATLITAPWLMGFAATPWHQLIAVWIGLASGQLFMRASVYDMGRNR